ncbi:hypothetical protein AC630_05655 [Bradyrhizobium sp. AS23.2]|nr:hypothetical protein AC630_05655 [Bradyrhizobium sp. AS23.2]
MFVVLLVMAPSSQELEPPANPGRFRYVLAAPVAVVHEPATMDRASIMECLLQSIEHEACMRRARGPPAHDPASIGVDDKGDVDEAGPGCDIGEVGEPKDVPPWRLERKRGVEALENFCTQS